MAFYIPEAPTTGVQIDDTLASTETVFSSLKVSTELAGKADQTDLDAKADTTDLPTFQSADDEIQRLYAHFSGDTHKYITSSNVIYGQPLQHWFDSSDNKLKVRAYQSVPQNNHDFAGIACSNKLVGQVVEVLHHGITNVKRTSVYNIIQDYVRDSDLELDNVNYGSSTGGITVLLNAATNGGSVFVGNTAGTGIRFRDSGNAGDYSANENYSITFAAPEGSKLAIRFTDFTFEHASSIVYDWLQLRCSDTDSSPSNSDTPLFAFMHSMISNSLTATSFESSDWQASSGDSQSNGGGWVLPESSTRALLTNSDIVAANERWASDAWFVLPRYCSFTFRSDSSAQEPGWDFDLRSISATSSAVNAVVGTQLSVSSTDPTVAEDSTAHSFGIVIRPEASFDEVTALIGHG